MGLNIKNERTHALVRQLAELTGQSQTSAVEDAVRHRIEQVEAERRAVAGDLDLARQQIDQILVAYRAELTEADRERMRTADTWLYTDEGLPR